MAPILECRSAPRRRIRKEREPQDIRLGEKQHLLPKKPNFGFAIPRSMDLLKAGQMEKLGDGEVKAREAIEGKDGARAKVVLLPSATRAQRVSVERN